MTGQLPGGPDSPGQPRHLASVPVHSPGTGGSSGELVVRRAFSAVELRPSAALDELWARLLGPTPSEMAEG
jgi:hypothetical protein